MPEPLDLEEMLARLARDVSPVYGERFFRALLDLLLDQLQADVALVCEEVAGERLRTIHIADAEGPLEPVTYDLEGTPCEEVVRGEVCVHPRDVAGRFPDDEMLRELDAEGYLGVPLFDSTDEPLGLLAILTRDPIRDPDLLTQLLRVAAARTGAELERLRAEEAVRQSKRELREVIERTPDCVAIIRDERLVYVNPATCRTLGHDDPAALVGRSVREILHPDEPARALAELRNGGGDDLPPPREVRTVRRDGETVTLEVAPVREVQFEGEPGTLVVARDVTERKRMQGRLLLADRMAAMGTLAAGVAHEINNPLTYLQGNLEFIAEKLPSPDEPGAPPDLREAAEALDDARKGVERVGHIVSDLQSFSRSDEEHRGPVDVHEVLESTIHLAGNEIRHRARLVRDLGTIPLARAHEARLSQVFLNLLLNAVQALPEGEGGHEIRLRTWTDEEGRASIEVRDSGHGISPDDMDRIFDPFFTTKPTGVGTGLGLFVCHGIVTGLGGEIAVESEPGEGTAFRVHLPPADEPISAPVEETPPSGERPPARLLFIDDEPALGSVIERTLAGSYDIRVVESGREAIEVLLEGDDRFDVVFCDLMMPDVTGMDVYDRVADSRPDLARRFVFMTGGAFTPPAREFVDEHDPPTLEKPFDLETIHDIVRDHVGAGVAGDRP